MKANEIIHGGLYLIHDANDVVVRYDIVSNTFKSDYYEYPLALFNDDVCATDGDRYIFVKPIPLSEEILKANGFEVCSVNKFISTGQGVTITIRKNYTIFSFAQNYIKIKTFVHQLQHAFRLCGLNDIADNFKIQ